MNIYMQSGLFCQYGIIGVLEYWSVGVLEKYSSLEGFLFALLHCSITPLLQRPEVLVFHNFLTSKGVE